MDDTKAFLCTIVVLFLQSNFMLHDFCSGEDFKCCLIVILQNYAKCQWNNVHVFCPSAGFMLVSLI